MQFNFVVRVKTEKFVQQVADIFEMFLNNGGIGYCSFSAVEAYPAAVIELLSSVRQYAEITFRLICTIPAEHYFCTVLIDYNAEFCG